VWVGFWRDENVPSPNVHLQVAHTAGLLVDVVASNATARGALPLVWFAVNLATGTAGGGVCVTDIVVLCVELVLPPVVIAVSVTV
jgi:hypothetical protein